MAELATTEVAERLRDWRNTRGIYHASSTVLKGYLEMLSYERCKDDKDTFMETFGMFIENSNPVMARELVQRHGDRYLVQNRPQRLLDGDELDSLHEFDFENAVYSYYASIGRVRAMDTVHSSITIHRGCYRDCSFCSIAVHQGTTVVSRSEESILREAKRIAYKLRFDGVINDVGGTTANMYGVECRT